MKNLDKYGKLLETLCKYSFITLGITILSFFIVVGGIKSLDNTGTRSHYILNTIFILYIIGNISFLVSSFILLIIGIFNNKNIKTLYQIFGIGIGISISFPVFGIIGCDYNEPVLCIVGKVAEITIIYGIIGIIICAIAQLINKLKSKEKSQKNKD